MKILHVKNFAERDRLRTQFSLHFIIDKYERAHPFTHEAKAIKMEELSRAGVYPRLPCAQRDMGPNDQGSANV